MLSGSRFGYTNMKDPKDATKYIHHWKANFAAKYAPQPAKMIRLAQEIADISNSLPIDSTNAMFVRADEERLDVMKAVIFGAEGCPYAHGAFEYDIYFENDYPNIAPKVNLETTGNGDVRFNPNLYNCGKVCLSLLGTWRGNASESWDPKLSTLSQILISIQAVVMSEEVYFNEPGYGHEAGTEAGELKNVGYSNIVRLCNIKYAMIGQIENPSKGFENVIRTHFVLKKDKILKTVESWKAMAAEKEATYTGLVADHNSSYCERFRTKPNSYPEELAAAIEKLQKTLDSLEMPPIEALLGSKVSKVKLGKEKKQVIEMSNGQGKIDEIDVTYDENIQLKSMAMDEAGVKDRWSRYIGVMGMESVAKQANASVFISGLNSLGVEVAKNLVLSGAKRITLHDSKIAEWTDLAGQFFLGEQDIGKNRAEACINKIQQLNFYVKVDLGFKQQSLPTVEKDLEILKDYEVVVLIDATAAEISAVSRVCRQFNRSLIVADCHGIFSRVFCDFGPKFVCIDKNGEEAAEVIVNSISCDEHGIVTLLEDTRHTFEDGDTVVFSNVEGMNWKVIPEAKEGEPEQPKSINGIPFQIKYINTKSFKIGDTRDFEPYVRGGVIKQIKVPFEIEFKPYHEVYSTDKPMFDPLNDFLDFMKAETHQIIHTIYVAIDFFRVANNRLPNPYSLKDAKDLYARVLKIIEGYGKEYADIEKRVAAIKKLVFRFAMTCRGNFGPQSAYIGGIVSQEIVKAITGKFKPIVQTMYADSIEVLDETLFPENINTIKTGEYEQLVKTSGAAPKGDREDGIRIILGETVLEVIKHANLFMVGSGAIGCELLKNYAMIGLGTGDADSKHPKKGQIILTDPDVIEVSNLNRQFLFREKHLRKPKSVTAAAAIQSMNPKLQGHLTARLDKVHEATSNIFTDQFFEGLSIVTNALDNIQARRYIDNRCVSARTLLIDSGTLGPKGHIQVIIPHVTESYNSVKDATDEVDVPYCTLKMFPEETLHCVEWARDLFGLLFTQTPQALRKSLEELKEGNLSTTEMKALIDSVKLAKKAPTSFDDCVLFARKKFEQYFFYDIKQLLYVYPVDFKDKDGNPFWKLPKRPPTPIVFDPENKLHQNFIISMACLRAKLFGLPLPENARDEQTKLEVAKKASLIEMAPFKASDEKAQEMSSAVQKEIVKPTSVIEEEPKTEQTGVQAEEAKPELYDTLKADLTKAAETLKPENIHPEEFEKDNDLNYHIDIICSMTNLRASNYKLDPMEWITVKIKAGRIVPALATTTASIAGLQSLEAVKVLKKIKVEDIKSVNLNLAVPFVTQFEPAAAPKVKLTDTLSVTLWDRWEIKDCADKTLEDVFKIIETEYKIYPRDVIQGAKSVFMRAVGTDQSILKAKLGQLFEASKGDYEDLTITCSLSESDKSVLQGVPQIRLLF